MNERQIYKIVMMVYEDLEYHIGEEITYDIIEKIADKLETAINEVNTNE